MIYPNKKYNTRHKIVILLCILLGLAVQVIPYLATINKEVPHRKCIELVSNPKCESNENVHAYTVSSGGDQLSLLTDSKTCQEYYDKPAHRSILPGPLFVIAGLIVLADLIAALYWSLVFLIWLIKKIYSWTED